MGAECGAVAVVGDWSDWAPTALRPIETDVPTGIWSAAVPSARSGHRYKFEITADDGAVHRKADPMARRTERPPSDASVVPMAPSISGATTSGWRRGVR